MPCAAGLAQAKQLLDAIRIDHSIGLRIRVEIKNAFDDSSAPAKAEAQNSDAALANSNDPCLGCGDTQTKDHPDASTDQSVQENTARR